MQQRFDLEPRRGRVDFIERLSPEIVLQRLFATAPDDILIAPRWGKTRQKILLDIRERFISRNAFQGSLYRLHLQSRKPR